MTPWMCAILRVMSWRVRAPHTVVMSPTAMYGSIICGPPPPLHYYSLMDVQPRKDHDSDGRPSTTAVCVAPPHAVRQPAGDSIVRVLRRGPRPDRCPHVGTRDSPRVRKNGAASVE